MKPEQLPEKLWGSGEIPRTSLKTISSSKLCRREIGWQASIGGFAEQERWSDIEWTDATWNPVSGCKIRTRH
jgi:hypothetical protein